MALCRTDFFLKKNVVGRLFLHAPNVHQGGGKTLLDALLAALPCNVEVLAQLDSRMVLPANFAVNLTMRFVDPSVKQRFLAEWWLAKNTQPQDIVLCFGNLPPLFKPCGRVFVFVQNRYLVDTKKLGGLPFKTQLRLNVERFWLSNRMATVDEFVVQTPSMKNLLGVLTRSKIPIDVFPFVGNHGGYQRRVRSMQMKAEQDVDFLYVASGEPHKNHRKLIEAWCLLADEGLFPSLNLTLDSVDFPDLCSWVEGMRAQNRLNLINMGRLPHEKVAPLYSRAKALIYPSAFESFGLPLIEARQAGLSVLAPELDYVRDVLDPEQTFDPESAVSIARAVKRCLGFEESPLSLQDASSFIKQILRKWN